jgi:tRNA nucleotidyltransferase/poly(A) polymerase
MLSGLHPAAVAGHEVLLVGGAVRDLLLQRGEPKDYDILTSAQLKQVPLLIAWQLFGIICCHILVVAPCSKQAGV